jgi:uncharacterized protein
VIFDLHAIEHRLTFGSGGEVNIFSVVRPCWVVCSRLHQLCRFFTAYDTAKLVLKDLNIYPQKSTNEERECLELDEFESGYPRLTLLHLIDIAGFFLAKLSGSDYEPYSTEFKGTKETAQIKQRVGAVQTNHEISWKALLGRLWRLHRTGVFDRRNADSINFAELVKGGKVSIIDLSDTDSTLINNLVIANILRGDGGLNAIYREVHI